MRSLEELADKTLLSGEAYCRPKLEQTGDGAREELDVGKRTDKGLPSS